MMITSDEPSVFCTKTVITSSQYKVAKKTSSYQPQTPSKLFKPELQIRTLHTRFEAIYRSNGEYIITWKVC